MKIKEKLLLIIVVVCSVGFLTNCQEKDRSSDVEELIKKDICDCLENIPSDEEINKLSEQLNDCYEDGFEKNKKQLDIYLEKQKDKKKAYDDLDFKIWMQVQYANEYIFNLNTRVLNEMPYKFEPTKYDSIYNTWKVEDVKVSKNPIDLKKGTFVSYLGSAAAYVMINEDKIIEVLPYGVDTADFKVEWENEYSYTSTFIGSRKGMSRFEVGKKFLIKFIEVNDSGYIALVPSRKNKIMDLSYTKIK